jgi:hypothetical protein
LQVLTDQQIIEYYHRSYQAVDGLWFMKVEKKIGFHSALNLDLKVWKVMPKIQARMIKSMLNLDDNKDDLIISLKTKLSIEGFKSKLEINKNKFKITITDCPWHNIMIKSNREKYSGKIGEKICNVEYSAWASEFGSEYKFILEAQKCKNSKYCVLVFKKANIVNAE